MTDSNDFLMGGGGASAKFDQVGDTIAGTIVSTEVRQQTKLEDGTPLTWENGDPRMQLVVTLQTDAHDDTDDDGKRALYVKGSKSPGSQSLHDAVRAAVQGARAKGLEVGGTLTVSYIGDEPSKTRGFNPRKLYSATYAAPDHAAATADFLGGSVGGQPTAPTTPPVSAPAAAPVSAPTPVVPAPAAPVVEDPATKVRQLIALGLDDTKIAGALGLDATVVAAFRTAA
jgi:hypothetical protein